jgi:hypothetical protein
VTVYSDEQYKNDYDIEMKEAFIAVTGTIGANTIPLKDTAIKELGYPSSRLQECGGGKEPGSVKC